MPGFDKEPILDTDASGVAKAAILLKKDDQDELKTLVYASMGPQATERNWHIGEKEALAIVWSVQHFREYLITAPHIILNTDHKTFKWLWNLTTNRRITRWTLQLQEYNLTIVYQKEKEQAHVDTLTRNIANNVTDISGQRRVKTDMSYPLGTTCCDLDSEINEENRLYQRATNPKMYT